MHLYHIFFIHSSIHGHLYFFCILVIVNNAVKNRLNKYYNQEINMKNMKAKITSLREKCNEKTMN